MTQTEALKLALEALEEINKLSIGENAICLPAEIDTAMDAIKEALANVDTSDISQERVDETAKNRHEQEPVAKYMGETYRCPIVNLYKDIPVGALLYTTPPAAPEQEPVAWESLLGAIARGWCHEKNANKEMDADLAYAIATEIKALYTTPPAAPEQEPCQYAIDVAMPEHRCVGKCQYAAQRQWVGLTDEEIPEGVLLAIRRAGLTLVMTAQGYHLMNLGPIEAAHGIKE